MLSDEQVIDGECERCGAKVEKRELEQWFFRITKYAPVINGPSYIELPIEFTGQYNITSSYQVEYTLVNSIQKYP